VTVDEALQAVAAFFGVPEAAAMPHAESFELATDFDASDHAYEYGPTTGVYVVRGSVAHRGEHFGDFAIVQPLDADEEPIDLALRVNITGPDDDPEALARR
jgi:hypothetical protein